MAIVRNPFVYSFAAALLLTTFRELYKLLETKPDVRFEVLLLAAFTVVFAVFKWLNRNRSFLFIAGTVVFPTILLSILFYELLKLALLKESQELSYFTFRLSFNLPVLASGIGAMALLLPVCLFLRKQAIRAPLSSHLIDDGWLYE